MMLIFLVRAAARCSVTSVANSRHFLTTRCPPQVGEAHPGLLGGAAVGRGVAPLDAVIDQTVAAMGRRLDADQEAQSFAVRQDGWALARTPLPTVLPTALAQPAPVEH